MNKETVREANLWEALVVFGTLILIMAVSIVAYGADPHIPMFLGVIIATLVSLRIGYKWSAIEKFMIDGINQAMQSLIILIVIGILIGVWIVSGVVPTMISYGLSILSPGFFLPATVLITSITALATGSSWGTAGTMGIALMGIAAGLGIPAPMTAGAIVSGAYLGDKMSPLSDTTNLAPAMAGTDVFTHVKFMTVPTVITYLLSLVIFYFMGRPYGGGETNLSVIQEIQSGIAINFSVSPWLILPPVIVIVGIAMKIPAIPGIVLGILSAAGLGMLIQGNTLGELIASGMSGYVSDTGIANIDELLTNGGLEAMMYAVSLTVIAMMFGGIAESTGMLKILLGVILKNVRSTIGLISATMLSSLFSNLTMPEQYISIIIPGRMFKKAYSERGLHPKSLSNALESSGTISSPLIPWSTCGVFMATALGVPTLEYAPYAVFNLLTPVVVILLTYIGTTVAYMTEEEKTVMAEKATV
ncbi:transporter, NhaC family [Marinilactibacillus piezotolerans]|uniref:Transporter, NhaC family n=1 Tax=Marinilactibacillus piezotolerans TaxID=258723 RepID=A0A1I3ZUP3_9LACT|nr:Na+/H+ antiporter NhaC [Marinilactibacillus piezotolerans]SFK47768.1 transporter, NhaC family [Marinilactibacillus piezotolerans]